MQKDNSRGSQRTRMTELKSRLHRPGALTPIGTAVLLALYGSPHLARAQQAAGPSDQLAEVTVTATRRPETRSEERV